jgi:hypothetical protein
LVRVDEPGAALLPALPIRTASGGEGLMGIFAKLAHRMPHTVSFRPYDREASADGTYVYDESAEFQMTPAQIVEGDAKSIGDAGDVAIPTGQVIVGPTVVVDETMQMVLPGDVAVRITHVERIPDENGLAVQVVHYG